MTEIEAYVRDSSLTPFERLVRIMECLRSENGCAWDKAQTHQSLLPYLLEETYEVLEAIEEGRYEDLAEELGDLQIQIVFHSQIAKDNGLFELDDCLNLISEKLIRRHPHVFGDQQELSPDQVRDQWEKIKTESGEKKSVLSGVPKKLPALTMAFRVGEKAAGVGFDWTDIKDVLAKINEELAETTEELKDADNIDKERVASEIGDLLFATASLARHLEIDPELALRQALNKFKNRFDMMERQIKKSGSTFQAHTLEELEEIWQTIKKEPDADS